ncbi:MAG: DUF2938 family protein [Ghiorsea sp.]|nr:DUF2938 family protein [Ghiorsea sp.]
MEIWLVSFIGGVIGSIFMDLTEFQVSKLGISSGVKGVYIGRWFHGILNGVFMYQDISKTKPIKNEKSMGQIFHFIVGGGVVALFYPVFLNVSGLETTSNHLVLASIFGLLTCLLPWFILMPSFGWGLFGAKTPFESKPIIAPIISHLPFGFGIGITFIFYYEIMA